MRRGRAALALLLLTGCATSRPDTSSPGDCAGVASGFAQTTEAKSQLAAALKREVIGPLASRSLLPPGKSVLSLRVAADGHIVEARLEPATQSDPALLEALAGSRLPSPCGAQAVELQVPLNARP